MKTLIACLVMMLLLSGAGTVKPERIALGVNDQFKKDLTPVANQLDEVTKRFDASSQKLEKILR